MKRILAALLGLLLFASLASADTLFPNAPTDGQIYNFNNTGVLYQYSSAKGAWGTTGTTSPAITKQVFTASGTYTPSSGMQYAIIECVGSGGGGGGVALSSVYGQGGGGGGGSYSRTYVTAAQVGTSQTVTVGAAGTGGTAGANNGTSGSDVSVGTLCVGKGGSFGGGAVANSNGLGGAGGVAGTGDVTLPGGTGQTGSNSTTAANTVAAAGGDAGGGFGLGGRNVSFITNPGTAGNNYGGGGSGGGSGSSSAAAAGGNGAKGIVVITEYLASAWGGPLPQVVLPGGRLTTASATPVPTTDQTAITTIYYTPYKGTFTPLWNGTQFTPVYTAELSAAMGSNWAANSNYDWFEYNDAGTLRLCSGPAWTSDTARGTGAGTTQLTLTQGILVNTVSMTCRYSNAATVTVAAGYGTYLGTMRTTGSTGTTQIKFGSSAAGGGEAWFGIWNQYNRVRTSLTVTDSTASWTYGTATIRPLDNSTTNRVSVVSGQQEDGISLRSQVRAGLSTAATNVQTGFDRNGTTAFDGPAADFSINSTITLANDIWGTIDAVPFGFEFFQATERVGGGVAVTFGGSGAAPGTWISGSWAY